MPWRQGEVSPQAVQREPGENPDIDQGVGSSDVILRFRILNLHPVPYLGAREGATSGGSGEASSVRM